MSIDRPGALSHNPKLNPNFHFYNVVKCGVNIVIFRVTTCLATLINIKYDIFKMQKRNLRWKKFNQAFQDEQQKQNFDTLKSTWSDPARQQRCKKWNRKIYYSNFVKKQVFRLNRYSVFCFLMLHLLAINHPSAFRVQNSFQVNQ